MVWLFFTVTQSNYKQHAMHAEVMIFSFISKILSRKLNNKQRNGCLNVRHQLHCGLLLGLSQKFVGAFTPKELLGLHIATKKIWYHFDDNHCIIGLKLKRTFSSLKHHCSPPEDASFVKLKAVLDSTEVMTKLLVAKCFTAENKSAASHFHRAMKTESVEIHSDESGCPL